MLTAIPLAAQTAPRSASSSTSAASVIDNLQNGAAVKTDSAAEKTPSTGGAADEEEFDEEEFEKNYSGPNIGVIYDERSKSGYFVIDTDEQYKEYHYLEQIRYDDLLFVLTDTLSRLTKDGYRWSSSPELEVFTEKLPESEVAFIYEIDKKQNVVNARVQFPDFKISVSAVKTRDNRHRYDASSGRDMFQLINTFAYRINEVESVLGMDNIEYTMRFFRKNAPENSGSAEETAPENPDNAAKPAPDAAIPPSTVPQAR
jgi:hypothetical protein